ncbi:MAG: hypothetical protein WD266_08425 [Balneolales bacterium]
MNTKSKPLVDNNKMVDVNEGLSGVSGDGFLELDSTDNNPSPTEQSKVIQTRYGNICFEPAQSEEDKVMILHEAIAILERQLYGKTSFSK